MVFKAIVTDLDGTLLRDDKTVSQHTLSVLEKCRRMGVKIIIATARSRFGAEEIVRQVSPDAVIFNGGAEVTAGGQTLHRSMLTAQQVRQLIDGCRSLSATADITVQTSSGYYWNYTEKPTGEYADAIYTDYTDFHSDALKVTAVVEGEENARRLAQEAGCNVVFFRGEDWRQFMREDATKQHGVKLLCDYYGISQKEVVAFGDDHNDVEMLQHCGCGVAMGNAPDFVRAAADRVTSDNNSDGVAEFLAGEIIRAQ